MTFLLAYFALLCNLLGDNIMLQSVPSLIPTSNPQLFFQLKTSFLKILLDLSGLIYPKPDKWLRRGIGSNNQTQSLYFKVLLCKKALNGMCPSQQNPRRILFLGRDITVLKISGSLLILVQWRVKYINTENVEAEIFQQPTIMYPYIISTKENF